VHLTKDDYEILEDFDLYILAKKGHFVYVRARLSALFIGTTFENYESYSFYEILVMIKSINININVCFF